MQYQVLIQNPSSENFIASVIGMSNLQTEGKTEEEAIFKLKSTLAKLLASGKVVNIEVDSKTQPQETIPTMKYAGIFADDSSFDDFMDKLALIRQESNLEMEDLP
jgi:predicted RNase H-like HicB family nuclease